MNDRDFSMILASLIHRPAREIQRSIRSLRKENVLNDELKTDDFIRIFFAVLASSINNTNWLRVSGMLLQGPYEEDALSYQNREAFIQLVGKTSSLLSRNGYLTFEETLNALMTRMKENAGVIELLSLEIGVYGQRLTGKIQFSYKGENCQCVFSENGWIVPDEGQYHSVMISRRILTEFSWLVSSQSLILSCC